MVCEVDCLKQSLHQDDLKSLDSLPVEAVRIVNRICLSVSLINQNSIINSMITAKLKSKIFCAPGATGTIF